MLSDLPFIYLFWLTLFIIGIINLPLTAILFRQFIDKGYIFSKILGLIFVAYLVWLLSSLKILAFTSETIILVAAFLTLFNLYLLIRFKKGVGRVKLILFEEILFTTGLFFWSFVRGFEPSIHGLEKFMDFGFVNSILRTKYLPPLDMWLSATADFPKTFINYYYFGHFTTALLTKISRVPSEISYNITLGALFGFTFTGAFSIALNLFASFQKQVSILSKKALVCGLLAGFLVALGGNLHTIYIFTRGYPLENPEAPWELLGTTNLNAYWYPNATRFIPNTIHEFPIYSFVVSDLHGHVLDIPFVLLTIALLFAFLKSKFQSSNVKSNPKLKLQNNEKLRFGILNLNWILDFGFWILLLGLLLAVMYMTNAWDAIIYMGLSALVLLIINTSISPEKSSQPKYQISNIKYQKYNLKFKIGNIEISFSFLTFIVHCSLLIVNFIVFSLPFNRHFVPFAKGIGINCITANASGQVLCEHSPIWMMIILWGYFYFFALSFLWFIIRPRLRQLLNLQPTTYNLPARNATHSARLPGLARPSGQVAGAQPITSSDIFVLLLILLSTLLLIAPEFIFARDIYPAHYRANTMFKLGYQAFMMLGIVVSYVFFRFLEVSPFNQQSPRRSPFEHLRGGPERSRTGLLGWWRWGKKRLWWKCALIQLFLVAIYPIFAINSYYNGLKNYQGLNGLLWLQNLYPEDYQVIEYFRKSIPQFEQPTILEAVGDSYTDYGRISANSGLPTVLGWPVHEWLWRGSFDEAGKRQEEVRRIYEGEDLGEVKKLLEKYRVDYVVIGRLESEKYPNLNEDIFYNLGTIVFNKGSIRVYKLRLLDS